MSDAAPETSAVATATGDSCPNCHAAMHGPYCYACGQPRRGMIRPLSGIVADFLDTVFNVDARIWRTLAPLYFKPGLLSNEYFAGRRVRYVTPLRLYFFLSIVAFLVISAVANVDDVKMQRADDRSPTAAERAAAAEPALRFVPEAAREEVRAELEREVAADAARAAATGERAGDAVRDAADDGPPQITIGGGRPWHRTENPLRIGWLSDGLNAALNDEIGVLVDKLDEIEKDPGPFFEELFSIAPQALFFILPLFALLLKLFFAFKRRLYMEHMIVALHSHSFLCLSLLVIVGLVSLQSYTARYAAIEPLFGLAIGAAALWIPLYLLLMQRRVYRQNWFATVLKFVLIGICYVVLLSFGLLAALLASLVFL